MSTSFLRTTARGADATTGLFAPETPTRLFPGADEMSVVAVVKLLSAAIVGDIELLAGRSGPNVGPVYSGGWQLGFDRNYPEAYLGVVNTAGAYVFGECRPFTALDVDKVHRIVGTGSVADGFVRAYLNGQIGISAAQVGFLPSAAPSAYGVLGGVVTTGPDGALRNMELIDLAVVDRAFTAAEVAQLDDLILATGGIPASFADWNELYRAERLVGHKGVWDAGGRSAGRGWLAVGNEPELSSILITPDVWGGSGT
jgi:hypothetical protein